MRIGILTAGGDTPALNATLYGAVTRANQRQIEVFGFIKGFSSLFNQRVPHVHLNPLFTTIPELDPYRGGTILGASRDYVDGDDAQAVEKIADRFKQLKLDGLICVGGDGTLNGMQALSNILPTVLAPKTIDNDLGMNFGNEPDSWRRLGSLAEFPTPPESANRPTAVAGHWYDRTPTGTNFDIERMINYVTPGYATAVFVSASGVNRIRTTAESHRRIAIVEVMGRHSGYIALGAMYGQPDILLVPEHRLNVDRLVEQVKYFYGLQKNVVIVCGEGVIDESGQELGAEKNSTDPAGNKVLTGASEALRQLLIERLGDSYFTSRRRNESAKAAIFTRKVGHTQRGGRPILFDRFHATQLGAQSLDMLLERRHNSVAILQWNQRKGFHVDGLHANDFRDQWGLIHARQLHPSFYDPKTLRPSETGIKYLEPIFTNPMGSDDIELMRSDLFEGGRIALPYHSVNSDINKRIRFLEGT